MANPDPISDPFGGAAPITTPAIPVYQERYLSEFQAPARDVLGTLFHDAFDELPSIKNEEVTDLYESKHGQSTRAGTYMFKPGTASPLLSPDDARAQLKERGIEGQIEIPESGIRQKTLDILAEHRIEQNRRNAILARSPGGLALNAAGVVGTLAISSLDPVNIASAFLPVVGEARYARMLEAAGESVLRRTAVRAGVGAAEGITGGALLEPLHIASANAFQDDYTMNDSLANLAFQGLFGAAMHQIPAAAHWLGRRLSRGIPVETQKAALSESISAMMEDRQPRVSELIEGIGRSELMGSTSLSRAERFDPTLEPGRFEPETGTLRVPEEEARASRTAAVEARAREIEPEAFAEHDRLRAEKETYTRWIEELKQTRDQNPNSLEQQIKKTEQQLEEAPNQRKAKIYQKRLDELKAQREGDTPDMATVRQKLQQADFKMRDLAETISAAKRRAEADIPERTGLNEAANVTPDRDDLAYSGSLRTEPVRTTLDRELDATAPDQRSLMGVLTRIRDDRVSLPVDDARLMAETTRATPGYNKPLTPEAGEAELTAYAAATDDAVNTMAASGRLTEADMAILVDADQQIALSEQKGMGWKAATACIARAFT